MKVYRYEHIDDGLGPFRCKKYTDDFSFNPFKKHLVPIFQEEFRKFVSKLPEWNGLNLSPYLFGMGSLDELYDLLVYPKEQMIVAGFVVAVYEVDGDFCVLSDGQVMFNKEKAKKLVKDVEVVL